MNLKEAREILNSMPLAEALSICNGRGRPDSIEPATRYLEGYEQGVRDAVDKVKLLSSGIEVVKDFCNDGFIRSRLEFSLELFGENEILKLLEELKL